VIDALAFVELTQPGIDLLPKLELGHDVGDRRVVRKTLVDVDECLLGGHGESFLLSQVRLSQQLHE